MPNRRITISNTVLRATSALSITHKRILWVVMSSIRHKEKLESNREFLLDINELAHLLDIKHYDAFRLMKREIPLLKSKVLVIPLDKGTRYTSWVARADILEDPKRIVIVFSDDFLPFISELVNRFSILNLKVALSFSSIYTWKLYDLFYTYKRLGKVTEFEIEVCSLRALLNCPASYEQFKLFNSKILQVAIKELGDLGVAEVRVGKRKVGRRVTGLRFEVGWL